MHWHVYQVDNGRYQPNGMGYVVYSVVERQNLMEMLKHAKASGATYLIPIVERCIDKGCKATPR